MGSWIKKTISLFISQINSKLKTFGFNLASTHFVEISMINKIQTNLVQIVEIIYYKLREKFSSGVG
jgi:hypothetical protein